MTTPTPKSGTPLPQGLLYLDARDSMVSLIQHTVEQVTAIRAHLQDLLREHKLSTEEEYASARIEIAITRLLDTIEQNCGVVAYKLEQVEKRGESC